MSSSSTSDYVTYCSFSLLYAGLVSAIVYCCSARGENAYYSLVASNSIIFFGMVILMVNLFALAFQGASKWVPMIGTTVFMFFFFYSAGDEIYLLLKNKTHIINDEISASFYSFFNLSLLLTLVIIVILSYIFKKTNPSLSTISIVSLCLFAFLKFIFCGYINNLLTYFLTDGFYPGHKFIG